MFNKAVQKVMSVSLAVALTVAPYSTAFATTDAGTTLIVVSDSGSDSGSGSSEPAPVISEAENVVNSTVAGVGRSTVNGVFTAKSVAGVAVTTPAANLAAALGLSGNERAHVVTWDVTAAKSPAAYASLQAAAQSIGGTAGPMIQFNLNKMSGGKLQPLTSGEVSVAFGIPANFRGGANYAVARVVSGGAIQILQDTDSNPNTVTVNIPAGNGALAIVRY